MARASWRASLAMERVSVAAIFSLAGTIFLLAIGNAALSAFVIAGAVVTMGAGLAAVAACATLRAAATDAIAVGDDRVGVRELDMTRRRLTSVRFRAQLARTLDAYARTPAPSSRRVWDPILPGTPSSSARDAMCAVGALLRSEPAPSSRVVARCSRLITAGHASPPSQPNPPHLNASCGASAISLPRLATTIPRAHAPAAATQGKGLPYAVGQTARACSADEHG